MRVSWAQRLDGEAAGVVAAEPSLATGIEFGLADGLSLAELVELEDGDELLESLPLDEVLDELVSADGDDAIDEIFRRLGDA